MQRSFFLALKYGSQAMSTTSNDKNSARGSIVVTGSMAGVSGAVSDISYLAGMIKSASVQLSASNIRVNAISPGFVRTSIAATSGSTVSGNAFDEKLTKDMAENVFESIMGNGGVETYYHDRIPEPVEIANLGVFLASDLAASVNAQNIVADSGKTAAAFGESIIQPIKPMKPLI
ncbi:3-alpha-(or 20-beta)-hydroxysteroid dehydrogenase [Colletotrichum liriopes]|uniref:3-alpha-(Or 20-beta)-hydroxysteroid dehydrogenase n=1 Tax=Colletotrichum liriopes TaxID=708192 RepID=A0AA37GGN5_9PEZI|nr:3-alpha-(or 20-beta)-hydroxysteroid dehydrogenase [Colletotrichum liriopes]